MHFPSASLAFMALASLCAVANAWVLEVNTPTLTQVRLVILVQLRSSHFS